MSPVDARRALSFGKLAEEYARWRPGYPPEAVDWLARNATHVAEVGAGTGKLTAALVARRLTVEAVEPDPDMLAVLRRVCPEVTTHLAGADALPLPDASVDAVLVADAWHWFPRERAVAEVRRVLRPGGWLGLVWNVPRPVEDWELELAGLDPDRKGLDDVVGADSEPLPTSHSRRPRRPPSRGRGS
jgi:SAM-dependent methyltransferase